jgi:GNAT superfamily N-acetyltransferase
MATALIAKLEGEPVGYAGLTPTMVLHEGKIRIDIHHLYVKERARSKGVGKALIEAATAHAKATGATRLTIGTDPNNATAIAAYRAMPILEEITGGGPRFRVDLLT